MAGARKHRDVRACTEHAIDSTINDDHLDRRVLKTKPLDRVGELDIDTEIVAVELEFVAFAKTAIAINLHGESSDLTLDVELPVLVAIGVRVERDLRHRRETIEKPQRRSHRRRVETQNRRLSPSRVALWC